MHPAVCPDFEFRVLRQNRRVVAGAGTEDRQEELENFHQVLADISWGRPTPRVREFIVDAYVKRQRTCGSAEHAELEGSTSVFAKRRYRDRWNRTIVRGQAKVRNHNLKTGVGSSWLSVSSAWTRPYAQRVLTQPLFRQLDQGACAGSGCQESMAQ